MSERRSRTLSESQEEWVFACVTVYEALPIKLLTAFEKLDSIH
jgi:hypothetical protein